MTFEHPIWLALTPLIVLFAMGLLALGWRKRSRLLTRFAATRLLENLTEKASLKRRLVKSALMVAALAALALALARPQYGVEWSERKARGLDIVFALDSSKSMLATDLRPNRLERAKLAILDLIDRLESDRVGLVAFAGQAFLQTPPTLDYGAFRESLDATDPTILSRGGSDLGRAIEEAAQAFPSENNVKVVVLLTDGEDLAGQAIDSAREAAEDEGIQVFTIGIGTPEGEYLRIRNTEGAEEFVRDADGQPVRSQLDESTLQEIARITGGSYSRLSGSSLEALYESVLATLPREERNSEMEEVAIERFQWLLAAALIFLVLEMLIRSRRPGASQLSSLLVALLLVSPTNSEAQPYNQAHAALGDGDYTKANELYTEAMQQTDDRALQRDALYNMGHATYQLGREAYEKGEAEAALKEMRSAEKLFESARELDPSDSDISQDLERTRAVRETIEKFLEQQKEQQQKQDQQDQQDGDESKERKDQESDPSETQDEEGSQQENQESQQQEQSDTGQQEQNDQSDSGQQEQSESGQQEQEQPGEAQENEAADGSESEEDAPSQEQAGQERPSEGDAEESDAPESAATEEQPPEEADESQPVPEVDEPEEGETGEATTGAAESADAAPTQGMSPEEAQVLLDSLRGKEEILPFAKPAPSNGRPSQDW